MATTKTTPTKTTTARKATAKKAPASKTTTAKAPAAKPAAKAGLGLPKDDAAAIKELGAAGADVLRLREQLNDAVAHRNRLMAQAYERGLGVMNISRATGFTSAGAAQAAIKAAKP